MRRQDPGERADYVSFARTHVCKPHRISALGGALKRAWMEHLFRTFALSLFACPARLLERRARNYARSHSQCGRPAPRRDRAAATDERLTRTRLSGLWRPRYQLWWMDRRIARNG